MTWPSVTPLVRKLTLVIAARPPAAAPSGMFAGCSKEAPPGGLVIKQARELTRVSEKLSSWQIMSVFEKFASAQSR